MSTLELVPQQPTVLKSRRSRGPLSPARQGLAVQHLALARRLAGRQFRRWPRERDEFESSALLALVEAAEAFDPRRGIQFTTFARHRIEGAMRDVQRRLYARTRPWDRLSEELTPAENGPGLNDHAARVLGIQSQPAVGAELEGQDAVEHWLRALPRRYAEACRELYVHGRNQTEAAAVLGISQSRLSAMHRAALAMLQAHVQGHGGPGQGSAA